MFQPTEFFRRFCMGFVSFIVAIVLLCSCGPGPFEKQFRQQIALTKQQCKATEVRRAVLLHKDRWDDPNRAYIPLDQWPKEIRNIALFPDSVGDLSLWVFDSSLGTQALGLVAGGGFGHWGIIVCIDSNSVPKTMGKVVPWEDGVYFWRD